MVKYTRYSCAVYFLFQRSASFQLVSQNLPTTPFLEVFSFSWLQQKKNNNKQHLFNQGLLIMAWIIERLYIGHEYEYGYQFPTYWKAVTEKLVPILTAWIDNAGPFKNFFFNMITLVRSRNFFNTVVTLLIYFFVVPFFFLFVLWLLSINT